MPRVKRIAGVMGVPRRWLRAEGTIDVAALELTIVELPGVVGGGMPGRNGQRKTGTARGWPRRSRTAEASHISRCAVKLRCAREQGGWGRLSVDGRGSITRTGARAPGVGGAFHRMAVQYIASTDPTLGGSTLKHEGRRQTECRAVYAGSRLKLIDVSGRSRLIRQPSSRTEENSPYGMSGGIVERSSRQGRSLAGCKSPHRQLPVLRRLVYPMRGEATSRVLLGRKSPGCPAVIRSGRDDLGGEQTWRPEHNEISASSKISPARSRFKRNRRGKPTHLSIGE